MDGGRKRPAVSAFAARPVSSTPRQAAAGEDVLELLEEELLMDDQGYDDSMESDDEAAAAPPVHPSRQASAKSERANDKLAACSTWRWTTTSLNMDIAAHAVLTLQEGESVCFCGYFDMAVLYGAVEVNGYVASAGPTLLFRTLYSPRSSSLLSVRAPFPPSSAPSSAGSVLYEGHLEIAQQLQGLVDTNAQGCSAMIVVREPNQDARAKVAAVCRGRHYRTLFALDKDTESKEPDMLGISTARLVLTPREGLRQLMAPPEWVGFAQTLLYSSDPCVALVCGGKDVGKSCLSRYLVNALLSRYPHVAHLELDIGQGECTPPGILALTICDQPLLGPAAFQQQRPRTQFFAGDTSAKHDPVYYMQCVRALVTDFRESGLNVPLVVNTHGWIKGIGLELLHAVTALVQPTHVAAFTSPGAPASLTMPPLVPNAVAMAIERDLLGVLNGWPRLDPPRPHLLVEMPIISKGPSASGFRAADYRQMALAAYFAPHKLTTYAVPLKSVALHVTNTEVARSQILYALNASVVGLLADPAAEQWIAENQNEALELLPRFLQATPVAPCVGLGYIKAIDAEKGVLYLTTPVDPSDLARVSALARGAVDMDPELCPSRPGKEYTMPAMAKHASGAGVRTNRRGLMRRKHQ